MPLTLCDFPPLDYHDVLFQLYSCHFFARKKETKAARLIDMMINGKCCSYS